METQLAKLEELNQSLEKAIDKLEQEQNVSNYKEGLSLTKKMMKLIEDLESELSGECVISKEVLVLKANITALSRSIERLKESKPRETPIGRDR